VTVIDCLVVSFVVSVFGIRNEQKKNYKIVKIQGLADLLGSPVIACRTSLEGFAVMVDRHRVCLFFGKKIKKKVLCEFSLFN